VRLEFKKPWSDGTSSVELAPLALIARLAALVPAPKYPMHGPRLEACRLVGHVWTHGKCKDVERTSQRMASEWAERSQIR